MQRYSRDTRVIVSSLCIALFGVALFAAVSAAPALACLNDGSEDHAHDPSRAGIIKPAVLNTLLHPPLFDTSLAMQQIAEFERQDLAGAAASTPQRYGIALVQAGRYEQARDVWIKLEEAQPGEYATAANLGTAYELTGDNVNALKWIKEGIQRNPDSHEGTEWLHVRILEAKLALESDPQWLEHNSVLGLDFGDHAKPRAVQSWGSGNRADPLKLEDVVRALTYQLGERTKFIRTPEPVVAQLLSDLGACLLLSDAPSAAAVAYKRARDYGAAGRLLETRVAYADKAVKALEFRLFWHTELWLPLGSVLLLLTLLGLFNARRQRAQRLALLQRRD